MCLSLERILFQFLALVNQIIQFILIKVFLLERIIHLFVQLIG